MDKLKNLPREKHMFLARIWLAAVVCLGLTGVLLTPGGVVSTTLKVARSVSDTPSHVTVSVPFEV